MNKILDPIFLEECTVTEESNDTYYFFLINSKYKSYSLQKEIVEAKSEILFEKIKKYLLNHQDFKYCFCEHELPYNEHLNHIVFIKDLK